MYLIFPQSLSVASVFLEIWEIALELDQQIYEISWKGG